MPYAFLNGDLKKTKTNKLKWVYYIVSKYLKFM